MGAPEVVLVRLRYYYCPNNNRNCNIYKTYQSSRSTKTVVLKLFISLYFLLEVFSFKEITIRARNVIQNNDTRIFLSRTRK